MQYLYKVTTGNNTEPYRLHSKHLGQPVASFTTSNVLMGLGWLDKFALLKNVYLQGEGSGLLFPS